MRPLSILFILAFICIALLGFGDYPRDRLGEIQVSKYSGYDYKAPTIRDTFRGRC